MGLGQWFEDRWHDAEHAVGDVADAVDKGIDAIGDGFGYLADKVSDFWKLNFGDGSVGGTDPNAIYRWFHEGPGTPSYEAAKGIFKDLQSDYGAMSKDIHAAKQSLSSGWSGPAAQQAHAALAKVTNNFDQVRSFSGTAADQLDGQIGTFNDTKHKVEQVPKDPPQGGGLSTFTPAGMAQGAVADVNVAAYQSKAKGNQQAYQSYGGATTPQGAGLPTQQIQPGHRPDTGVDQGTIGPGYVRASTLPTMGNDQGGIQHQDTNGSTGKVRDSGYQTPGALSPSGAHTPPPSTKPYISHRVPDQPGSPGRPLNPGPISGAGPKGANGFRLPGGPAVPRPGGYGGGSLDALGGLAAGGLGAGVGYGSGSSTRSPRSSGAVRGPAGAEGGAEAKGAKGAAAPKEPAQPGARSAAKAAAAAEGAALREGAAGRPGAAGGAVPPGGRGKKEEDGEHKTAGYLVHEEHGNEIVGDMPVTAPPVIGE